MTAYDKPNYTQIPNDLLDIHMVDMSEAELKVTLVIARQTFGWHKRSDQISLSQLVAKTGMTRQSVVNGLKAGLERGTVQRRRKGGTFVYSINVKDLPSLNFRPEDEEASLKNRLEEVQNLDQKDAKLVQKLDTQKKDLKKHLKKGEESLDSGLVEYLPEEQEFLERIAEKANIQTYDNQLQMRTLVGWRMQYGEERVLEALNYYLLKGKKFADALASMQGSLPTWRTGVQTPATKSTINFSNVG